MKPFKNIRPKHRYRLKHILLLGCIFCAIILYNIGFSNKVFGGIIDYNSIDIDSSNPTCGYIATIKGEDYFGGCSHEQYDECIDGNRLNAIYTRLVNAFGRKTACIQQCSVNNTVEFIGQLTNEDVLVTLTGCSKPVTITNNSGRNQYLFTENGEFTFEFKDNNGRTGETWVRINGINRIDPECNVFYSQETLTSGDVVATLTGCNKELSGVQMSYTFTGNGNYTFDLLDKYGNTGYTHAVVHRIDKEKPVCAIEYSTQQNTTGEVIAILTGCSEEITDSETIYIFEENGTHTFVYRDLVGNTNQDVATVDYILSNDAITGLNHTIDDGNITLTWSGIYDGNLGIYLWNENSVIYQKLGDVNIEDESFTFPTQREGGHLIKIIPNNGGKDIYYSIEYHNTKPVVTLKCEIEYNPDNTNMTNQNVISRLVNCNKKIEVTNNNGNKIYTFRRNGSFTFEFKDEDNNTGKLSANVDWIDKNPPECDIIYSTSEITDGPVVAELDTENCTETINIDSDFTYTFYENGSYVFYFTDLVGNIGAAKAEVNWINDSQSGDSQGSAPICNIVYSTESPTNENVVATLTGCNREIIIDNYNHVFTENDVYIFNFTDGSGNIGQKVANVTWIDKNLPHCDVQYSITGLTNQDVLANISCDEDIIIENNNHENSYIFTGNSEFIFEVSDLVGNIISVPANVTWIDKQSPICEVTYTTTQRTNGEVIATLTNCSEQISPISGYTLYHRFSSNGSHTIIFRDIVGNIGSVKAEVNWIIVDNGNNDEQETGSDEQEYPITGVNHSFHDDYVILTWIPLISGNMNIYALNYDNTYFWLDTIPTNYEYYVLEPAKDYEIKFSPVDSDTKDVYYTILSPESGDEPSNPDEPNNPDEPELPVDNKIPTCDISYSPSHETSEYVIATLYGCSEEIKPLEGFNTYHLFADNGNYGFYFMDNNGNIGTARANVNWIVHDSHPDATNYAITGLSHTISGTKINLSWTPLTNGIVEIYLGDTNSTEFNKIGSTNINYGGFLTDITRKGEYLFKFVPMNGDAVTYYVYIDNYLGSDNTPICQLKYDYLKNSVVASLTDCDREISVINNGGKKSHVFEDGENKFTFEYKDNIGNVESLTAYIRYSEDFDNYDNDHLSNFLSIGNLVSGPQNNYLAIHSNTPFSGSFTLTGQNILLDNGAILEGNVTCVLSKGNDLTINIGGLGSKSVSDIIVPGNFAGYISYPLPKVFYTDDIYINFDLDIKKAPEGSCLIDDVSIISRPNSVLSTKKTEAKTGTYYKSKYIEITGLPENMAIPIFASIDYNDTTIQNYGKCINDNGNSINYCEGKYITDIVLYKNGEVITGGETVGQNGDIFQIKVKSSIYENSNITANLMFGHTNKSIISQFSVITNNTGENVHGSAEFEFDYSSFDSNYEFEWNQAYQYSHFYGITTKSPIKNADMRGNLTRIAMAKMLSQYAINVLGLKVNDSKKCSFNDVTWAENNAYDEGVSNACKLGIMGQNMPNNEFRPYDLVTRAEFATALSRLLYNTEDGKVFYYSTHIDKLESKKIINDTNPNLIEKKGYIMLMLMRAKDSLE